MRPLAALAGSAVIAVLTGCSTAPERTSAPIPTAETLATLFPLNSPSSGQAVTTTTQVSVEFDRQSVRAANIEPGSLGPLARVKFIVQSTDAESEAAACVRSYLAGAQKVQCLGYASEADYTFTLTPGPYGTRLCHSVVGNGTDDGRVDASVMDEGLRILDQCPSTR